MIRLFIYELAVAAITPGLKLAALWNSKAKKRYQAEKSLWEDWEQKLRDRNPALPALWVHCASLGEFELILPVLQKIRDNKKNGVFIALSFYSPSGYEQRKNHPIADAVGYMPSDTNRHARRMVQLINADLFILVKYEFWLNHLRVLFEKNTKVIVAGARFHAGQSYFGWLYSMYKPVFSKVTTFMLQDETSAHFLNNKGFSNHAVFGDARIDRCVEIASKEAKFPLIEKFLAGSKALIVGSSWPEDEKYWIPALGSLPENYKVIIAPHEISIRQLSALVEKLPGGSIYYSSLTLMKTETDARFLIIDHVGDLAKIYGYGDLAYVGGAWDKGLHNIMEPLAYRIPVVFGPKIEKFPEARDAVKYGFGFSVQNIEELRAVFATCSQPELLENIKLKTGIYLKKNEGASIRMAKEILHYLNTDAQSV